MTKVIIISWLIGVVCGVGFILVRQSEDRNAPNTSAASHTAPQASTAAPNSANVDADKK
jgi:hypothetical protein